MLLQSSSHIPQLAAGVNSLLTRGKLLDMTLAAGGKSIKVHKVVMAAASKYFEELLLSQEELAPVIFFRDVTFMEMECLVRYIYTGEVEVAAPALQSFLTLAHSLGVSGFAQNTSDNTTNIDKTPTKRKLDWGADSHAAPLDNSTIDTAAKSSVIKTDNNNDNLLVRTPLKSKFAVPAAVSQPSTPKSYSEPVSLLETVLQCSNSKKRKLHTQSLTDNLENIDPNFLSMSSFKSSMQKGESSGRSKCDHQRNLYGDHPCDEPLATPHRDEFFHCRMSGDVIRGSGGGVRPTLERTDSNATVRIKPSPVKDRTTPNYHVPSSSLPAQSQTPPGGGSKTTPKSGASGAGGGGAGASNFSFDSHFLDPDELAAKGATLLHHLAVWMIQQRKEGPQHYHHGSGFIGDELPAPRDEDNGVVSAQTEFCREATPAHAPNQNTSVTSAAASNSRVITRHATSSLPASSSAGPVARSSFYSSPHPPVLSTSNALHRHSYHSAAGGVSSHHMTARRSLLSGSGDAERPDSGFDSKDDSKDDQEDDTNNITIIKKETNTGVAMASSSGSSPEIGEISRQTFARQPVKKKRVFHHNII